MPSLFRTTCGCAVGLLVALSLPRQARGQFLPPASPGLPLDSLVTRDSDLWRWVGGSGGDFEPAHRAPRIALFRMATGFLNDPLGLDPDGDDPSLMPLEPAADETHNRVQVTLGMDKPFYDFRRAGDPGGIGFYRLHTQYQLVDTGPTGLTIGLQAVTPAGLEVDGAAEGPTILSPNLAWFQELGNGAALQASVAKNIRANPQWLERMEGGLHYGMAFQYPCPGLCEAPNRGLYFFIEGLGRYRYEDVPGRRCAAWEVVPGLHYRVSDDFWVSFGAARTGLLTCSWRY